MNSPNLQTLAGVDDTQILLAVELVAGLHEADAAAIRFWDGEDACDCEMCVRASSPERYAPAAQSLIAGELTLPLTGRRSHFLPRALERLADAEMLRQAGIADPSQTQGRHWALEPDAVHLLASLEDDNHGIDRPELRRWRQVRRQAQSLLPSSREAVRSSLDAAHELLAENETNSTAYVGAADVVFDELIKLAHLMFRAHDWQAPHPDDYR